MASSIKFLTDEGKPDPVGRGLAAVAEILGVKAAEVAIPGDYSVGDSLLSQLLSGYALITSAEGLANLVKRSRAGVPSLSSLISGLRFLLIYGFDCCSLDSARLLFENDASAVAD